MTRVKVSEASGPVLDWTVAKALGVDYLGKFCVDAIGGEHEPTCFSTDWAQGGPIIEREEIGAYKGEPGAAHPEWHAYRWGRRGAEFKGYGPTPLVAAMRCFVASKLGDEVDVPEELT